MSSKHQARGESTKAAVLGEFREPISLKRWSDSRSMREEFGMAPWDREAF